MSPWPSRPVPAETRRGRPGPRGLDQVDELLDGLLVLARAAARRRSPAGPCSRWITSSPRPWPPTPDAIAARNLTLQHASDDDGTWVDGSQPLLRRLADNLIDNAIGHNRDGGWVAVTTAAMARVARLIVENGGDVLDACQVAELAQPFRRLGADRTGSDDGAGLGLSIVAAIADAHHGSLDLRRPARGGLRVAVTLPLAARASPPGSPMRVLVVEDARSLADGSPRACGTRAWPWTSPATGWKPRPNSTSTPTTWSSLTATCPAFTATPSAR